VYDAAKISEYFDQECIYQVDWLRISSLEIIKQLFDLVEGLDMMLNELKGRCRLLVLEGYRYSMVII
jgi:hypothetical protein